MPLMLAYIVRRISNEGDGPTLYHLYDESGDLLFVAKPGIPDSLEETPTHRHITFRKPDGTAVASLDLPWTDAARREGPPQYALIHDDAVYALLTGAGPAADSDSVRLFGVEVEGKRWVGLRPSGDNQPLLNFYEGVASDLSIIGDLEAADLPDPIAVLEAGDSDNTFNVRVTRGRLIQPGLLALALVLLVDSARG